jgi:predicted phosphodiesterase
MKLGLISDIHGNLQALERILATLDDNGVEMILCAGDLVCYGADHEQVLRVLRERHIPCVVGNYDYAVAWDQPRASEKSSSLLTEPLKQAALDWTKTHISVVFANMLNT